MNDRVRDLVKQEPGRVYSVVQTLDFQRRCCQFARELAEFVQSRLEGDLASLSARERGEAVWQALAGLGWTMAGLLDPSDAVTRHRRNFESGKLPVMLNSAGSLDPIIGFMAALARTEADLDEIEHAVNTGEIDLEDCKRRAAIEDDNPPDDDTPDDDTPDEELKN